MKLFPLVPTFLCWLSLVRGDGNGLNFLVLGDWGGAEVRPYTTDIEEHIAKQMAITAQHTDAKFVVALGKLSNNRIPKT